MLYLFIALVAIAVALILILILVVYHPEENYIHSSGGIDLDSGQNGFEDLHGYHGLDFGTVVIKRKPVRVIIFVEECSTRNQYRAELGNEVVIGRIVNGNPNINDLSVSWSINVSRRHCRLFEYNKKVMIENISKTTFTSLNGNVISSPMEIHVGDFIGLGDAQLRVIAIHRF